jgi:hypothetical protein
MAILRGAVPADPAGRIHRVEAARGRPTRETPAEKPQETLSQLVARILDQLSVSAWLPAAALVFGALLVGNLRLADGDLSEAIARIGELDLGPLVLLVAAVVMTTMLTQAFEFEAIRLLEGYWGTRRLPAWLADVRCRRHLKRRNTLRRRAADAETRALMAAQERMLREGSSPVHVGVLVAMKTEGDLSQVSKADEEAARKLDWMRRAPARELRRMDALLKASAEYPKSDRLVLPTRLGNALRAREVPVHGASAGRLESFVHRVFDELPVALQTEHDQFRSRLDLYCSLVLVFVIGGAAGAALLAGVGATPAAAFAGVAAVLAWVSYRAAVASARAYGGLLKTIADVSATR